MSQNTTVSKQYMSRNIFVTEKNRHKTYCLQNGTACPVLSFLFCLSCSACSFYLSCSSCPVLSFMFCLPVLPFRFCLACSACPNLPVLSCLACSAVLFWPSCFACPLTPAQFCLSCSAYPVLPVLFCLPCSACPVLPVLFWLFCSDCPVLTVLFWLSSSVCPFLHVLFCLPYSTVPEWTHSTRVLFITVPFCDSFVLPWMRPSPEPDFYVIFIIMTFRLFFSDRLNRLCMQSFRGWKNAQKFLAE